MAPTRIDELIEKLDTARESFDKATGSIRWNRINTVIQYALIAAVFLMGGLFVMYYFDQRRMQCENGNLLRASLVESQEDNALAIGLALADTLDASPERVSEYMAAYQEERPDPVFEERNC